MWWVSTKKCLFSPRASLALFSLVGLPQCVLLLFVLNIWFTSIQCIYTIYFFSLRRLPSGVKVVNTAPVPGQTQHEEPDHKTEPRSSVSDLVNSLTSEMLMVSAVRFAAMNCCMVWRREALHPPYLDFLSPFSQGLLLEEAEAGHRWSQNEMKLYLFILIE